MKQKENTFTDRVQKAIDLILAEALLIKQAVIICSRMESDIWRGGIEETYVLLNPGGLIVIYHGKPHRGAIKNKKTRKVKKVVCKISVKERP